MSVVGESGLEVHSAVEASLYLMVTPCPNCGRGPVRAEATDAAASPDPLSRAFRLPGTCSACRATWQARFRLAPESPLPIAAFGATEAPINSTNTPSSVIDVAQWLTLCRMLVSDSDACRDRVHGRRLKVLAGRCAEEALKFFDEAQGELPPESAFFHEETRRVLRENPQAFARNRVLALRAKLPSPIRER